MIRFKLRFTAGAFAATVAVIPVFRASAGEPVPAAKAGQTVKAELEGLDLLHIQQRAEACQAAPDERKFDQIGWATQILEAEKLAKEHNRPVFLFTHDGRINTGRC